MDRSSVSQMLGKKALCMISGFVLNEITLQYGHKYLYSEMSYLFQQDFLPSKWTSDCSLTGFQKIIVV